MTLPSRVALAWALVSMALPCRAAQPLSDQDTLENAIMEVGALRARLLKGCRFVMLSSGTEDGKQFSLNRYKLAFAAKRYVRELRESPGEEPAAFSPLEVVACNQDYSFRLKRNGPDKAWLLADIMIDNPVRLLTKGRRPGFSALSFDQIVSQAIFPFLEVEGVALESLFRDGSFRTKLIQHDGNRIRIDFDSDVESHLGPDRLLGGSLWLLPESCWVLDEYHVTIMTRLAGKSAVTMKSGWTKLGELPQPERVKIDYAAEKRPVVSNETVYSDWEFAAESPERFTLTHYGLPEPKGMPAPSRPHWYLWLGLAALGSFLLAVLCKKCGRHWRERAEAQDPRKR